MLSCDLFGTTMILNSLYLFHYFFRYKKLTNIRKRTMGLPGEDLHT